MRRLGPIASAALLTACGVLSCSGGDSSNKPPLRPGDAVLGLTVALKKCTLCHAIEGRGNRLAPAMEESLAKARTWVDGYPDRAKTLAANDPKTFKRSQAAIERIAAEADAKKRFALWFDAYLLDPKFDNPASRMQVCLLSEQERADVVAWVVSQTPAR
jgi:cytochrome c2